jgi:gliding motility-associated protein GldL
VDNELDWSLVYPELATGKGQRDQRRKLSDSQGMLSQKLDAMLKDAKIDGELMSSLGNSIKNFESAAKVLLQQLNLWLQQKKVKS